MFRFYEGAVGGTIGGGFTSTCSILFVCGCGAFQQLPLSILDANVAERFRSGRFLYQGAASTFWKSSLLCLGWKAVVHYFLGATASCCYEAAAATAIFVLGADGGWVKLIFFERRLCVIVGRCC